jgi:hypothetical protein
MVERRHFNDIDSASFAQHPSIEVAAATASVVATAFFEALAQRPRLLASERDLPYPKATIKAALQVEARRQNDHQRTLICERLFLQLAGYRPDSEIAGCRELVAKLGEVAGASLKRPGGERGRIQRVFDRASAAAVESYRAAVDARSAECLALAAEWCHSFQQAAVH